MKRITLAIVMIVAFMFSVVPSASPPAHAQTMCEFGLIIMKPVLVCEPQDECMCPAGAVTVCMNTNPPTVSNTMDELRSCCDQCGGTVVPEFPETN